MKDGALCFKFPCFSRFCRMTHILNCPRHQYPFVLQLWWTSLCTRVGCSPCTSSSPCTQSSRTRLTSGSWRRRTTWTTMTLLLTNLSFSNTPLPSTWWRKGWSSNVCGHTMRAPVMASVCSKSTWVLSSLYICNLLNGNSAGGKPTFIWFVTEDNIDHG